MPVYPMVRRPRGQALIIDIETYENDVQVVNNASVWSDHDNEDRYRKEDWEQTWTWIIWWRCSRSVLATGENNFIATSSHVHVQGLEFEVRVHRDLALGPFYREVTEFCSSKLHSEADMAIVVILSHGQVGGELSTILCEDFHSAPSTC